MGKPIMDDELWALIEPLLPPPKPRRFKYPGRKPAADRAALTGILFVLKMGIRWRDLPSEMGCGSVASCWRRLRDWQQAGVCNRLHAALLAKLRAAEKIGFSRVVVDSSSIRAIGGGQKTGLPPTDRARPVSKHYIATDANGTPIAAILTGANRNDVIQLVPLIEAIVPIGGVRGRPMSRPARVYADRGYDQKKYRRILHERNIPTSIARRGHSHGNGLRKVRSFVERTHAWLHHIRRLRIRFERRADIHEAFLKFGCCLICWKILRRAQQSVGNRLQATRTHCH
ncbi:IS5 family transposase [Paraburkholderia mimosarum]|uniref:IS5 family transposase n=1 Tax=Paraburkholderia mimosarum TaxID=312026 RepID=UPI0012DDAE6E|nr:IS5 family transposase [Paraburkholderia mimosarum]